MYTEAREQTPRLREMLGAQGFSQVSVDVSQRSFQDRGAYSPPAYAIASPGETGPTQAAAMTGAATRVSTVSASALDTYA